jgi:hypothetical protein
LESDFCDYDAFARIADGEVEGETDDSDYEYITISASVISPFLSLAPDH